jgi:hypothetical protein
MDWSEHLRKGVENMAVEWLALNILLVLLHLVPLFSGVKYTLVSKSINVSVTPMEVLALQRKVSIRSNGNPKTLQRKNTPHNRSETRKDEFVALFCSSSTIIEFSTLLHCKGACCTANTPIVQCKLALAALQSRCCCIAKTTITFRST